MLKLVLLELQKIIKENKALSLRDATCMQDHANNSVDGHTGGGLQRVWRRWMAEETAVVGGRAVCLGGRMDVRTRGVRHE